MNIFNTLINEKDNLKDLDLYELIALFNALIHKKDNLYTNDKGEKFVLTRYGFVPADQPNLHFTIEQQNLQIKHLETEICVLKKELENIKEKYKKVNTELQNLKVNRKAIKKTEKNYELSTKQPII